MLRKILLIGCLYEIIALLDDRVPTITQIVHATNDHKLGKFAVWLWCGYVAAHFLDSD
jgi:hypothetical protein